MPSKLQQLKYQTRKTSAFYQGCPTTDLVGEFGKVKILENLAGIARKAVQVTFQIGIDACFPQLAKSIFEVLKKKRPLTHSNGFSYTSSGSFMALMCSYSVNTFFWYRQHAFQTAQQGKRQDDPPVLGLPEITSQQVSD